jgi:hypothetical protein
MLLSLSDCEAIPTWNHHSTLQISTISRNNLFLKKCCEPWLSIRKDKVSDFSNQSSQNVRY